MKKRIDVFDTATSLELLARVIHTLVGAICSQEESQGNRRG
jgi:hypothetical protein